MQVTVLAARIGDLLSVECLCKKLTSLKVSTSLLTLRFKSQHRVTLMKQTRKRTLRLLWCGKKVRQNKTTNADRQSKQHKIQCKRPNIYWKSEARQESQYTADSDWLSRKYHNKDTKSVFTGYTFVRGKCRTKFLLTSRHGDHHSRMSKQKS